MKDIILPNLVSTKLEFFYPVFDLMNNAIVLTDETSNILFVNPAYLQLTGYRKVELIGENPGIVRSGYHDAEFYKRIWKDLETCGFWKGTIWNRKKSGQVFASNVDILKIYSNGSFKPTYLGISSDITYYKLKEAQTINLAIYDLLTKLPNYSYLEEYCAKITQATTTKTGEHKVILLYLDISELKSINDLYGYVAGDGLLIEIAKRLKKNFKEPNFVARIEGDRFGIVLPSTDKKIDPTDCVSQINQIFASPFNVDGIDINCSCKIGTACFPEDGMTCKAMFQAAENRCK